MGWVKRGPGWWVGWMCVSSWPNKQISVLSSPVSVFATGWQRALMKPREEDLLCDSVVRLHSRLWPGQSKARIGGERLGGLKKRAVLLPAGQGLAILRLHEHWPVSTTNEICRFWNSEGSLNLTNDLTVKNFKESKRSSKTENVTQVLVTQHNLSRMTSNICFHNK